MNAPAPIRRPRSGGVTSEAKRQQREKDEQTLSCPVCFKLLLPHIVCGNGHLACLTCANEIHARKGACPICMEALRRPFVPVRALVDAVVGARVCRFMGTGCDVILMDADSQAAAAHESECKFKSTPCPHTGCGRAVLTSRLNDHVRDECPLRPATCSHPGCNAIHPFRVMATHLAECGHRQRACPYCDVLVTQANVLNHFTTIHALKIPARVDNHVSMLLRTETGAPSYLLALLRPSCYMCITCTVVLPTDVVRVDLKEFRINAKEHDPPYFVRYPGISGRIFGGGGSRMLYMSFPTNVGKSHVFEDRSMFSGFGLPDKRFPLSLLWDPTDVTNVNLPIDVDDDEEDEEDDDSEDDEEDEEGEE